MHEMIENFKNHLIDEEKSENTIYKYMRDINEFYKWYVATKYHESTGEAKCRGEHCEPIVTKEILLDYKEKLKRSKLKSTSINSKISSLNSFFTWHYDEKLRLKLIKCQKALFGCKERELTKYEYRKLYEASRNNDKLKHIIETISRTGIRVSEVKYITCESLKIGKTIVDNKGKIRTILIPRKICIVLRDYCRKNDINTGSIFLTRNGTAIDRKLIWQMLKNLADKAGVPKEKVFPHNLRHLFAREFYRETHDIAKLASILGHSSIETTRIYTKETEDECRIDIEKLDFAT